MLMRNHLVSVSARGHQRREGDRSEPKARQLLEAAGQVFAEKGFDRATGKEICERAGVNTAAVNYYFGGIEGLYVAVFEAAHGRLPSFEDVSAAIAGKSDPKAKLRAVMELIVRTITGPASSSWMFRVIGREFLSPSHAVEALREKQIVPKARLVKGIVSELMALPADHPAVARTCITVVAPFVMLLLGDRQLLRRVFPSLVLKPSDAEAMLDHMVTYALAGIAAAVGASRNHDHRAG